MKTHLGAEPLCVIGMHRSGTSVATYLAHRLGFEAGDPARLMPADAHNPKGYWENTRLVAMNDEILARLGGSWQDPPVMAPGWERSADLFDLRAKAPEILASELGDQGAWVWKDPRTSLTLPFWLPYLPKGTRFLICYRNPAEVCRSLQERDAIPPQKSSFLWQHYNASAIASTAGRPRHFLSYETWTSTEERSLEALGRFFLRADAGEKLFEETKGYFDRSLKHHRSTQEELSLETQIDFCAKWLYGVLGRNEAGAELDRLCRDLLETNYARIGIETALTKALSRERSLAADLRRIEAQDGELKRHVANLEKTIAEKEKASSARDLSVKQDAALRDAKISALEKTVSDLTHRQEARETALAHQYEVKEAALAQRMLHKDTRIADLVRRSAIREDLIAEKQRLIAAQNSSIAYLNKQLGILDAGLCQARAQLAAIYRSRLFRYSKWPRALWRTVFGGASDLFVTESGSPDRSGIVATSTSVSQAAPVKIKLRQIYFSEEQKDILMPEALPYFNRQGDPFLENRVLLEMAAQRDHADCDYYGVLSWRFVPKYRNRFTYASILRFIENDPVKADVYSFFADQPRANVWTRAVELAWHPPLFIEIGKKLFKKLGYTADILQLDTVPIYSNHWLARPAVFERFVSEMLRPAIQILESDEELRRLCMEDSGYAELFKDPAYREFMGHSGAKPEECQRVFGVPYYPYHPFICERLMSTWLAMRPDLRLTQMA